MRLLYSFHLYRTSSLHIEQGTFSLNTPAITSKLTMSRCAVSAGWFGKSDAGWSGRPQIDAEASDLIRPTGDAATLERGQHILLPWLAKREPVERQ